MLDILSEPRQDPLHGTRIDTETPLTYVQAHTSDLRIIRTACSLEPAEAWWLEPRRSARHPLRPDIRNDFQRQPHARTCPKHELTL